jgi:CMP-N-acetylneuraminic acid synthetase
MNNPTANNKTKIVALLPMRHSSERVPGKNYRLFSGRPLFYHILQSLLACSLISRVLIDTDSPIIMDEVSNNFPDVTLIKRPKHLCPGTVSMNDVLLYDISQVNADYYLQTHSTNPLLRTETIRKAIEYFLQNRSSYDSLFSVTRIHSRFWDGLTRAINHNPSILLRTQDLPAIFEENSCLYIFSKEVLERKFNRIGFRPLMFEIDRQEGMDIDEELDFQISEFLYKKRQQRSESK